MCRKPLTEMEKLRRVPIVEQMMGSEGRVESRVSPVEEFSHIAQVFTSDLQGTEAPTLSGPPQAPTPRDTCTTDHRPFSGGGASVPGEMDGTWLVSIHCHRVQSGRLIILKSGV